MASPTLPLWYAAVAAFGGGDYLTTKAGLAQEGVEESNPLADEVMGAVGPDAAMLSTKALVIAVAYAGYQYALRHPETEDYAPLFPALLLLVGVMVTAKNVQVLNDSGAL